jgi:glycosyltransferase involved in cell wall biosynthesis
MSQLIPSVSVVIPTYNRQLFLRKAIESVLSQKFSDFELIVVDDGSTDDTAEMVRGYGGQIRYIYQANAGPSSARNSGIAEARGRWLAFLDSDDEWCEDYLSTQLAHVETVPGLCMQSTNSRFVGLDGVTRSYFEINGCLEGIGSANSCVINEPFAFIVQHAPWQLGSVIMLREAVIRAGAFDERLAFSEDLDLMARVSKYGTFAVLGEELVNVYRRDEEMASLTKEASSHPLQAMRWNSEILDKLKKLESLNPKERTTVERLIGANQRAIGNFLWSSGQRHEARESYKAALRVDPSVSSIGRCVLSFLRAD